MMVSIDVEEGAWSAWHDLDVLAERAATMALAAARHAQGGEAIAVLFAGDATVAELNGRWRGVNAPTNVLSFPAPAHMPLPKGELRHLGDIIVAEGVTRREAAELGRTVPDHITHLIVHGVLHLLGYDHERDTDAEVMEALEIEILKRMGIGNPYERN
jgi:probable rRNA maturation factor